MTSKERRPRSITPERKDAFREFILSLPRRCSPTICGIVPKTTTGDDEVDDVFSNPIPVASSTMTSITSNSTSSRSNSLTVQHHPSNHNSNTSLMDISSISVNNTTATMDYSFQAEVFGAINDDSSFTWTIDEYAQLYGADFDNEHELDHFHEYESEHLSNHFTDESDRFFSQSVINPSPVSERKSFNADASAKSSDNYPRSTGSFIRYIEAFSSTITKSGEGNDKSSGMLADYTSSSSDDDNNFNQFNSPSPSKKSKKKAQRQLSFVDSDFVTGGSSNMDLSCSIGGDFFTGGPSSFTPIDSSKKQIFSDGFTQMESADMQAKYSKYLDFSPLSPISKRAGPGGGGCGNNSIRSNLLTKSIKKNYPMSSFALGDFGDPSGDMVSPMNDPDFANISPIVPIGRKQSRRFHRDNLKAKTNVISDLEFIPPPPPPPSTSICSYSKSTINTYFQATSPMSMSIDDISMISSHSETLSTSKHSNHHQVLDQTFSASSNNDDSTHDSNEENEEKWYDCPEDIKECNDELDRLFKRQQHWDAAFSPTGGKKHKATYSTNTKPAVLFKTPHSKQAITRKRSNGNRNHATKTATNRTKLIFNECTSTPNSIDF